MWLAQIAAGEFDIALIGQLPPAQLAVGGELEPGALEAVITILSLRAGVLFPTLRLQDPIDSEAIDWIRDGTRPESMTHAMSVSAGFGGSNTALVFSRGD